MQIFLILQQYAIFFSFVIDTVRFIVVTVEEFFVDSVPGPPSQSDEEKS